MNDHDPLEDRLRRALHDPAVHRQDDSTPVDSDGFLAAVHQGARRRRGVRVAGAAAAVALVAAGTVALVSGTVLDGRQTPAASSADTAPTADVTSAGFGPTTTSVGTDGATATIGSTLADGTIVSLTATGDAYQWVLAAKDDGSCSAPPCAVVYSTSGGGGSWSAPTPIGVALSTSGSADGVDQIRFARKSPTAEADGWAFGGALLSTHDDGRTWGPVAGVPAGDVVTHLEAWGDYVYATADGASPQLLRSPVGRDDWKPVAVQGGTGTFQALAASNGMAGFVDTAHNGRARVRVSTDDGASWVTTPLACPGASSAQLSAGVASMFVSCGTGSDATVQMTTDGVSWTTLAAPAVPFLLVGVTPDRGLAVTATTVYRLRPDAGPTAISRTPATDITYAGFTNEHIGYLIDASGQVWRTKLGGSQWSRYATHL